MGHACRDPVFAVRQVCETYMETGKDVFFPVYSFRKDE